MYGYRDKTVFCKFHPHKRCEHFCEDHASLLCSICLREKHRYCKIVEDHEFKSFYGRKIRHASEDIESDKNIMLRNTDGVAHALDTGITRLVHYRKELDEVINRMNSMKAEVQYQREDIRRTTQAFIDLERSMATATELKQCKQFYSSVDGEKHKFWRRQDKVIQMPPRFKEEISISILNLQKKLKNIGSGLTGELETINERQQYESPIPADSVSPNASYFDVKEKRVNTRNSMYTFIDKDGRQSRRSLQDDGRNSKRRQLKINIKIPNSRIKKEKYLPPIKFPSLRPKSENWHLT